MAVWWRENFRSKGRFLDVFHSSRDSIKNTILCQPSLVKSCERRAICRPSVVLNDCWKKLFVVHITFLHIIHNRSKVSTCGDRPLSLHSDSSIDLTGRIKYLTPTYPFIKRLEANTTLMFRRFCKGKFDWLRSAWYWNITQHTLCRALTLNGNT